MRITPCRACKGQRLKPTSLAVTVCDKNIFEVTDQSVRDLQKVLEIGTGSGYQAAVLREMGLEVFTIERVRELYEAVRELFPEGSPGIRMKLSDGTLGWRVQAPFDRIIVTAGGPNLPLPLLEQLADPGIMAIPVGRARREQKLLRVSKREGRVTARAFGNVAFVDLVGDHGW